MKVTIAGAGNVGRYIASDPREAGHDVLMLDKSPNPVERLRPTLDVNWFVGDACEVSSLHSAGIDGSDVMVAATGDDEDNLVVSLLAKQEFAVPRVVARVNHPKNQWLFNETWGVDVSRVSTPSPVERPSRGSRVGRSACPPAPQFGRRTGLASSRSRWPTASPAAGRSIADLAVLADATVVAVVRVRYVVVPRGDTVVNAGDEVLALVTPDSEEPVRSILIGT